MRFAGGIKKAGANYIFSDLGFLYPCRFLTFNITPSTIVDLPAMNFATKWNEVLIDKVETIIINI